MTCGDCIRWRRLQLPKTTRRVTRYGVCGWPKIGQAPYWIEKHPGGHVLVADCHGAECAAFKERKDRR